ncbi:MAG: hypothetical protein HY856_13520 [Burkholderiales bacterium]|nr:hypothetical protein [Burkholderiales bacterium]
MSVPYEVRKIAATLPILSVSHQVGWSDVLSRRFLEPDEAVHELRDICARKLSGEFADMLVRRGLITISDEMEGMVARTSAICLTYDQMVSLLTIAFNEGMKRQPKIEVPHGG